MLSFDANARKSGWTASQYVGTGVT